MPISFNEVPANLRIHGIFVEFDNSQAVRGLVGIPYRMLVIGQRLAAGTVAAETLVQVTSADQARQFFGVGSNLHHMIEAAKRNNRFTEMWAIALDDNGAGVAATGNINFSGPATGAGTLFLYIGGRRLTVAVANGDAANAIASAVQAAIAADTTLAVTAVVDGVDDTQVNLTAKHKGEIGNDLDVRFNYRDGEAFPAGVGAVITAMTGGTGNPVLTNLIAALGDEWFQIIASPYTDTTSLAALDTELTDRWGPIRQIEGHAFQGKAGTFSALSTFGNGQNSEFLTVIGANASPTPAYEWAAALAAIVAQHGQIDQARPFQTLELKGILPPVETDRFTIDERNLLLFDGISTFTVDSGGAVRIDRLITMWQTNAFGAPDTSFLDVNTMLTLGFLRWSLRARMGAKFPRHKLASDGTHFGPGQAVVTPKIAKGEVLALFRDWEAAGLVEGIDQFKEDLIVERNADDPNRLDLRLPPDLVNQLRVTAAQVQFLL